MKLYLVKLTKEIVNVLKKEDFPFRKLLAGDEFFCRSLHQDSPLCVLNVIPQTNRFPFRGVESVEVQLHYHNIVYVVEFFGKTKNLGFTIVDKVRRSKRKANH